jgi:hypothetical protein
MVSDGLAGFDLSVEFEHRKDPDTLFLKVAVNEKHLARCAFRFQEVLGGTEVRQRDGDIDIKAFAEEHVTGELQIKLFGIGAAPPKVHPRPGGGHKDGEGLEEFIGDIQPKRCYWVNRRVDHRAPGLL